MGEMLTRKGALIDVCSSCEGVWLDQGEINFFVKDRKILRQYETAGLEAAFSTFHKCPKCQSPAMQAGKIPGFHDQVEECPSCHGIYLDAHEFKKLQNVKYFKAIRPDQSGASNPLQKLPPPFTVKFSSLALTTGGVCIFLYGIVLAFAVFLMEMGELSFQWGFLAVAVFVVLQFCFAPLILDWQLKFFGSLDWVELDQLPPSFKKSLLSLCEENRIPIPRVGLIDDDSPQAYTYGRTPNSARVVFSRGMFKLLDEEEAEAVLAHELGHIKHWDFAIMTLIKLVPLILYRVFSIMRSLLKRKKGNNKLGFFMVSAFVVSYIFYLISEYLVLFVSRVREYHADRFSCFATKKPNKLLTALVKISYGLLSAEPTSKSMDDYEDNRRGVEALNIMNISRSKQLSLAYRQEKGNFSAQAIKEVMRWDMWSPWALYYELRSTHPLTAKRINAISSYALSMKQKPYILFNQKKPESYWDDFFIDLCVLLLPYVLGIAGACAYYWMFVFYGVHWIKQGQPLLGLLLTTWLGLSLGAFIRTLKSYPGGGASYSVASLLKLIKVSPVRSFPVVLNGHILGRGDAGNIFSEDFILKDKTGMIFLDHEPFGLDIFFALFRYEKFQGKEVEVKGWYRRAPSPYIEVRKIQTKDTSSWSLTYDYKMGLSLLGLLIPLGYFFLLIKPL